MQIKATFSDDGRLIISGSEDGMVYIWRANEDAPSRRYSMFRTSDIQKNTFFESFQVAYDNAATIVSVFAPSESVKHFVKVQEKLLEILKSTELQQQHQQALNAQPMKDQQKRNSKTFRGSMDLGRQRGRESFISTDPIGGIGGAFDTSCRVIATADSDGYIRFFFRLS
jgi:WD40 repeat protein